MHQGRGKDEIQPSPGQRKKSGAYPREEAGRSPNAIIKFYISKTACKSEPLSRKQVKCNFKTLGLHKSRNI